MSQDNWIGNGLGNWMSGPWSTGTPPTSSQDAYIGTNSGSALVFSDANETVNSVATAPDDVLAINNNSTFTASNGTGPNDNFGTIDVEDGSSLHLGGTFDNLAGTITLMSVGSPTTLAIQGSATLDGGGSVEFAPDGGQPNFNQLTGTSSNATLLNVDNDISGNGVIEGLNFINGPNGIVETDNSLGAGDLQIWGNANGGSFDNKGHVFADDGGTLQFGVSGASTTITNPGLIEATSGNAGALIEVLGTVSFQGGGQIVLGGPNLNGILGIGATDILGDGVSGPTTLDNVDNTISGAGTIVGSHTGTSTLKNEGTIDANVGAPLAIYAPITNDGGILKATSGGTLDLSKVNNAGGTISADGGIVSLFEPVTGNGAIQIGSNGTLDIDELENSFQVSGNVQFTGSNAVLQINNSYNPITGDIVGAGATDSILFSTVPFASGVQAVWQQNGSTGTLSVENGSGMSLAAVTLAGQYTSADFSAVAESGTTLVQVLNGPSSGGSGGPGSGGGGSGGQPPGGQIKYPMSGVTLGNGDTLDVLSGETASSDTVLAGGTVSVLAGGTVDGIKTDDPHDPKVSAQIDVQSGGAISGPTTLNGGELILDAGAVFEPNAKLTMLHTAELILEQDSFKGTIKDFSGSDFMDLNKIRFIGHGSDATTATWTQTNGAGGLLEVAHGAHVIDLHMIGNYSTGNFGLQSDGSHGTTVTFVH